MNFRRSLFLILLSITIAGAGQSEVVESIDRRLSSLRGLWEYHNYYNRWTLLFESDSRVIMDKDPKDYSLLPGVMRISDGGNTSDYPYEINNDMLTVQYPDGKEITFQHKERSEAEQEVTGRFYKDAKLLTGGQSISLTDDGMFYEGTYASGVYRVEGDVIIIAKDDGTTADANIRHRDDDGYADGIMFGDNLYNKDTYAENVPPAAPDPPVAYQPPPPDPPCFCDPIPPAPISVSSAPSRPVPPKKEEQSTVRGFGETRGSGRSGDRPQ